MLKGGCFCGAVRFEAGGEPSNETSCHCSICRRVSAAPSVAWVTVPSAEYRIVSGAPARFPSSDHGTRTFCPSCGTPLTFSSRHTPDEVDVTICSLDHPDDVAPKDSTFVSSKLSWVELDDRLPAFAGSRAEGSVPRQPSSGRERSSGLEDRRALDILTTEHWSLLSTRMLGYQEMFSRSTIFIAALTGTVVALTLISQAMHFSPQFLWLALVLLGGALLIGVATFVRSVAINYEDARWVTGMNLLRHAYLKMVPGLEPFFVTGHDPGADRRSLGHGSRQRLANVANSLTTTSGVAAALSSVVVGAIASDLGGLFGARPALVVAIGSGASIVSAALHVRYAARFRQSHPPVPAIPTSPAGPR